jgi:hypothetical protein
MNWADVIPGIMSREAFRERFRWHPESEGSAGLVTLPASHGLKIVSIISGFCAFRKILPQQPRAAGPTTSHEPGRSTNGFKLGCRLLVHFRQEVPRPVPHASALLETAQVGQDSQDAHV